ncbi:dihydroneopterin aldolase [Roseivirga sp. 4D4]|uniref:dihydroneopterin aldolase n=1 Tax=Roseivirga sp. 4D4 TaxID=1889784 RepID=UPI000853EFC8|nr:dihydroneopterin aldolase [Roseivirga sp. 4D4]OEK03602.1 dihydroneopterin aldolase [Roseivirga sp. 4D4]
MSKDIVSLEGMEFYAFHGFYEEEREKGNEFIVDVHVTTDFTIASEHDDLDGTVNYERIYAITKEEMAIPTKLLERVAQRILERLFEAFNDIFTIEISVAKKNPPVGGQVKQSRITMIRHK